MCHVLGRLIPYMHTNISSRFYNTISIGMHSSGTNRKYSKGSLGSCENGLFWHFNVNRTIDHKSIGDCDRFN